MTTATGSKSADAYLTQAITELLAESGFIPTSLESLKDWANQNTESIVKRSVKLQYELVSNYMANKEQVGQLMADRLYAQFNA
jgi:hypothetical protein